MNKLAFGKQETSTLINIIEIYCIKLVPYLSVVICLFRAFI